MGRAQIRFWDQKGRDKWGNEVDDLDVSLRQSDSKSKREARAKSSLFCRMWKGISKRKRQERMKAVEASVSSRAWRKGPQMKALVSLFKEKTCSLLITAKEGRAAEEKERFWDSGNQVEVAHSTTLILCKVSHQLRLSGVRPGLEPEPFTKQGHWVIQGQSAGKWH